MHRKKILIADDDIDTHGLLTAVLDPAKFTVMHTYNSQEAMEYATGEHPDLIILDIIMPSKDGRDICQALKKNHATEDILTLFLSSKDQQFDRTLGLELGADDYTIKPFSPKAMAAKIERMFI